MIRFTDIVPAEPPKKVSKPAPEREPAPLVATPSAAEMPKPVKAPRKPRKSD